MFYLADYEVTDVDYQTIQKLGLHVTDWLQKYLRLINVIEDLAKSVLLS